MDFALTEEQELLRKEIVRFAREALNDDVEQRDRLGEFSRAAWERAGELKLQGLIVPEEYGGVGLDPPERPADEALCCGDGVGDVGRRRLLGVVLLVEAHERGPQLLPVHGLQHWIVTVVVRRRQEDVFVDARLR